jgi:hypothetical protein
MIQHDFIHLPPSSELEARPANSINVQLWQFRLIVIGAVSALIIWAFTDAAVASLLMAFVVYTLISLPIALIAGRSIAYGMGNR